MNDPKFTIDPDLLGMLRCPKDGSLLAIADEPLVARVNERIGAGLQRDAMDQLVELPIEAALVTETGSRLYPIRGGIPTLIADEAIPLSS